MLDQKTFLQGINYLKANYLNWSFDLNNDLMIKVWYKKFNKLEPNIFINLVEKYTETNKYAPNSPADLLEVLKDQLEKKELNANQAWQLINDLKYKHSFELGAREIYLELENKPALYKTVKEFERDIKDAKRGDTYIMDAFKKAYQNNLKHLANEQLCLMTGSSILFLD